MRENQHDQEHHIRIPESGNLDLFPIDGNRLSFLWDLIYLVKSGVLPVRYYVTTPLSYPSGIISRRGVKKCNCWLSIWNITAATQIQTDGNMRHKLAISRYTKKCVRFFQFILWCVFFLRYASNYSSNKRYLQGNADRGRPRRTHIDLIGEVLQKCQVCSTRNWRACIDVWMRTRREDYVRIVADTVL